VGASAAILGPVTIGSHSIIGAHAVVVTDAPPNSVLTGIPAVARQRSVTLRPDVDYTDPGIYI
jgi:serine O-acetyltransferase